MLSVFNIGKCYSLLIIITFVIFIKINLRDGRQSINSTFWTQRNSLGKYVFSNVISLHLIFTSRTRCGSKRSLNVYEKFILIPKRQTNFCLQVYVHMYVCVYVFIYHISLTMAFNNIYNACHLFQCINILRIIS